MRGKIDTNLGWLRVVKTRPVSYAWSNQVKTMLDMNGKPEETSLALMVKPLKTTLNVMVSMV